MTHKCHAQLHFTPYLWHVRSGWSESLRKWIWALPICARNASTPRLVVEGHIGGEVVRERSFRKLNTQTSLQLSSWMFPLRAYCTLQVWRISTHEDDALVELKDGVCIFTVDTHRHIYIYICIYFWSTERRLPVFPACRGKVWTKVPDYEKLFKKMYVESQTVF